MLSFVNVPVVAGPAIIIELSSLSVAVIKNVSVFIFTVPVEEVDLNCLPSTVEATAPFEETGSGSTVFCAGS